MRAGPELFDISRVRQPETHSATCEQTDGGKNRQPLPVRVFNPGAPGPHNSAAAEPMRQMRREMAALLGQGGPMHTDGMRG